MSAKMSNTRKTVVTAMLGALASALMFISFSVPLMPSFIKLDFSELPALIASFSVGPFSGMAVCLIKNLVNLPFSTTSGVGELSNFILGCAFVFPSGLIYQKLKSRKGALIGSLVGAAGMAAISLVTNYFVVYPAYSIFMPMSAILDMYRVINPNIKTLFQALLIFNVPFTFIKGLLNVIITFVIYKKLSPIIKGKE